VQDELSQYIKNSDVNGKVVLLKVQGQMASGRTSDIDFGRIRRELLSMGPLCVLPNYSQLTSKEQILATQPLRPVDVTEREAFAGSIASVPTREARLRGKEGVEVAMVLLKAFKEQQKENETKAEYVLRVENSGLDILGIRASS
jgi:hypothetical protein